MSKPLDKAVVALAVEIESQLVRGKRVGEVDEYRRGYREALTELKNSVPMMDVMDAMRDLGWQPPHPYWVSPPNPVATPAHEPASAAPSQESGRE